MKQENILIKNKVGRVVEVEKSHGLYLLKKGAELITNKDYKTAAKIQKAEKEVEEIQKEIDETPVKKTVVRVKKK